MRKLLIAILLLTALLLAPLLALRSEITLLRIAYWAVDTFTDLRLELKAPILRPFEGIASAEEIHLYPKDDSGPPFISILNFSGDIDVRDFYTADLSRTSLRAYQVVIFVSDNDSKSDPVPLEWLQYLSWLPGELDIDQVHLVTASKNTFIFPLKGLQGRRTENDLFTAVAEAQYDGEPLKLDLQLSALRDQVKFTGLDMSGRFKAPGSGSEVRIDGELRGTIEDFNYDFKLVGNYTNINEFVRGFDHTGALAGVLQVKARMQGNTDGFKLTDAHFLLNNLPDYGVEAVGEMSYDRVGGDTIRLVAAGELTSMDLLLSWIDLDLQALGRAQGSATITGTLDQPVIEEFILHSESTEGLSVNVKGHLENAPVNLFTNHVAVDIYGPDLSVLEPWTGPLPYEIGQFSLSGILSGVRGNIALDKLIAELGSEETVAVRIEGSADNLAGVADNGLAAIKGLDLLVKPYAPDTANIAELLDLPLPSGFELKGAIRLEGTGDKIVPTGGSIQLVSSDAEAEIFAIGGMLQAAAENPLSGLKAGISLTLDDTAAISQFTTAEIPSLGAVAAQATLVQKSDLLSLEDIEFSIIGDSMNLRGKGTVGNVQTLEQISLTQKFSGAEIHSLLLTAMDEFEYDGELGQMEGTFSLAREAAGWNLKDIALTSSDKDGPLFFDVTGSIYDLAGLFNTDLNSQYSIKDPDLLEALTGLRMSPLQGQTNIRSESGKSRIENSTRVGDTHLQTLALVQHERGAISNLKFQLNSPRLHLDDLGLQAARDGTETYNPSQQLERMEPEKRLQERLKQSPRYPTDIAIEIDGIVGDYTNIDSLNLHVTGLDNRYTLRRFSIGYDNTIGEVRGIIDLNTSPPFVSIAGEALAIPLNTLGRDLGNKNDVKGQLTVRGGLTSQGYSADELLKDVDGSLAIALENAEIEGAAYDVLATDLLAWIYSGAAMEKSTHIDCTMGQFALLDGVATSDSIYIETDKMVAVGSAELDMVREKMDIKITPRSKTRQFQVPASVRLKGDFDDPKAIISPVAAAFDAYAEFMTLVPRMIIKAFGGKNKRKRSKRPCEAVN